MSTLRELFLGNREPFAGLWIENKVDWKPYPVIYVDMNALNYRMNHLEEEISGQIAGIAQT